MTASEQVRDLERDPEGCGLCRPEEGTFCTYHHGWLDALEAVLGEK